MSFFADPPNQYPCPYCSHARTGPNEPCGHCGWEPELSGDSRSDQYVAVGIGLVLAAALVIKVLRERR